MVLYCGVLCRNLEWSRLNTERHEGNLESRSLRSSHPHMLMCVRLDWTRLRPNGDTVWKPSGDFWSHWGQHNNQRCCLWETSYDVVITLRRVGISWNTDESVTSRTTVISGINCRQGQKDPSLVHSVHTDYGAQIPIQWVTWALSPEGKAAETWKWPLTPIYSQVQECVHLYHTIFH